MPGGLAMGLLGPRVGHLFDRFGGRPLVIPGRSGSALLLGVLAGFATIGRRPAWSCARSTC